MADNSAAKSHLRTLESRLSDMRDLNSLSAIIHQASLDLVNVLWWWKNLFVDDDIKSSVDLIVDRLCNSWWIQTDLDAQYKSIAANYTAAPVGNPWNTIRNNMSNEWLELERKDITHNAWSVAWAWATSRTTAMVSRYNEYHRIKTYIDWFNPTFTPSDLNINITAPTWTMNLTGWNTATFTPWDPQPRYEICDSDWNSIKSWSDYKVRIWGTEYALSWITWNNGTKQYDFSWLTIYPPLTTYPQKIDLSVSAVCSWITNWINVIHNKKFKLTLNDGTASVDTDAKRGSAFDDYNSSGWWVILDQLNTKINTINNDPEVWKNELERKALEAALKYKWGTKYDSLSETQKRLFYRRIRNRFFAPVYLAWWTIDDGNQRYEKMRAWFINGNRDWNKDKNITWSASSYKSFILSNLDKKCDEYISNTLQSYLQEDVRNTALKAELSKFLQEIDQNKLDDNDVNSWIDTDLKHRRYKMERWPRSPFRPRDVNYMRFLSGSLVSQKNQKVNIYSNIDKSEPVEYDMDLSVSWKNNIEVEIKIKWTNEIIKQKAAQPATLVRKIMREQRIENGKVRAHIWFNIYKSIIQIAQGKDISLTYRGMQWKIRWNKRSQETRKITLDGRWNIVIKQIDHTTTLNNEKDIFVFDQNTFLNSNEFDNGQTNWRLREWLETLAYHFNVAMNHLHKQYRKSTKRRILKLLPSRNRLRLPTSFWLSPIKKILNTKTTTNFDFNTTINAWWKNIKIDYVKNKFTITTVVIDVETKKEKTITISSRDLWKLLNHREWKVRVFDGVERDIVGWVYSSLVDALRKNSKIARTNFWVVDDITWNMYVLDEDGKFWVIAKEDFKWRNKIANPLRGWFRKAKKSWALKKKRLDKVWWRELTSWEEKELLKNPLLMQKFVKAMNKRMWLRWSIAALFN